MPSQEPARSPARRQPLPDRSSSSQSLSRETAATGNLLNTHRGSSTRLHKTHAVGQGRHAHARVPSHGKGLNKLSKLGPGPAIEETANARHHARSASQTPSTSPGALSNKRNSSAISLSRPSSKGSIKRNASHPALSRNGTVVKLGNQPKSEKEQTKDFSKKGTDDAPIRGMPQFEFGDDGQEDDWTEDSSSQSPATTRTHSRPKTPVTPNPKELPTPDEPPERISPRLPDSPPASPPSKNLTAENLNGSAVDQNHYHKEESPYRPPDAQAVSRLLRRNEHKGATPQASNISASITPQRAGSPSLSNSQASTVMVEPSLPADGISRFLSGTTSIAGSGTPGSMTQSQHTLANIYRTQQHPISTDEHRPGSSSKIDARRVKSAANLSKPQKNRESLTPPKSPGVDHDIRSRPQSSQSKQPFHPSPFESARGANPAAGKSYTQLKLNLDRQASSREPPLSSHPLLNKHGSMLNMAGTISSNAKDLEERIKRQYNQARKDVNHSRKYFPDVITSKIPEKAVKRHQAEKEQEGRIRDRGKKDGGSASGSSAETARSLRHLSAASEAARSRGRVRFEVGSRSSEDYGRDRRNSGDEPAERDGVDGLLRRMWNASEALIEEGSD